jgi:hypothetical protein
LNTSVTTAAPGALPKPQGDGGGPGNGAPSGLALVKRPPTLPQAQTVDLRHDTDCPRLVFPPHPAGPSSVDGHWWPRTRDLAVELPALVTAVAQRFGAVDRISLDPEAWDHRPGGVTIDGRAILLDWFGAGQRHVVGLFGPHSSHLELLVIPPDTAPIVALACLAAVRG